MRTTNDPDDDLIFVAKEFAGTPGIRNGVPLFTPREGAPQPSLELVNRLRDAE